MENIDNMIIKNEGLVYKVIKDFNYIPKHVEFEELLQVGRVALWNALENFVNDGSYAFGTYGYRMIKFNLLNFLRKAQAGKRTGLTISEDALKSESYNNIDDEIGGSLLIDEMKKYISIEDTAMFVDKHLHRMSMTELEEKYGICERSVCRRLKKSKEILQVNIKWEDNNYGDSTGFYENERAS